MQPMQHQVMGYDRAITMFSPDGRLLQVEYAKKTVKLGNTAVGMVCKDGILIVTDKRVTSKLLVKDAVEKIFIIDDHFIAAAAGIMSDARILIEQAREKAQNYRVTYDGPIDILSVVRSIADIKQYCTQSGGLRPFGVSIIFAGIDENGKNLYVTDPTGIYNKYYAIAIGEGEEKVNEYLEANYKKDITIKEGFELIKKALKEFLEDKYDVNRIDHLALTEKGVKKL